MHAEILPVSANAWPVGPSPASRHLDGVGAADALGVDGVRMRYGRDEEIFGESEPVTCIFRVLKGVVRTYRILADGRRQIAEFFLPGDVFGLEAGLEHRTSAEAVSDCEVLAMRRSVLAERASTDSSAAHKLWALSLHHLQRSEEHMLVLGRKSACERLAWFILDMSARIPAPDCVDLLVSRQDTADYLGLTIETVSRSMTQLQDEGLITLASARRVQLKAKTALADMAA